MLLPLVAASNYKLLYNSSSPTTATIQQGNVWEFSIPISKRARSIYFPLYVLKSLLLVILCVCGVEAALNRSRICFTSPTAAVVCCYGPPTTSTNSINHLIPRHLWHVIFHPLLNLSSCFCLGGYVVGSLSLSSAVSSCDYNDML